MTKINDGGPAFPCTKEQAAWFPGMSLRDYFATQMLPRIGVGWPNEENRSLIARQCYQMADAMLAERSKSKEQGT